jgi:Phosphotransferase enzyme family
VITHGEPHPGNVLRSGNRLLLIDWDTVGVALPERDLWHVTGSDSPEAAMYSELTRRVVCDDTALAAYRLCWQLDDLGLNVALFRSPHAGPLRRGHVGGPASPGRRHHAAGGRWPAWAAHPLLAGSAVPGRCRSPVA